MDWHVFANFENFNRHCIANAELFGTWLGDKSLGVKMTYFGAINPKLYAWMPMLTFASLFNTHIYSDIRSSTIIRLLLHLVYRKRRILNLQSSNYIHRLLQFVNSPLVQLSPFRD
jgi:hypothetical protein